MASKVLTQYEQNVLSKHNVLELSPSDLFYLMTIHRITGQEKHRRSQRRKKPLLINLQCGKQSILAQKTEQKTRALLSLPHNPSHHLKMKAH